MPRLSAIIITKNEAANIGACLDSVAFADERIVVDSGSTDDTVRIAESKGAKVSFHEFRGFGQQFNRALDLASGEWVFSIDADERVTPPLAAELQAAMASGKYDAYEMPRLSSFMGREMWHSGWYPDYVVRLWKRGTTRWNEDLVHPHPVTHGPVGRLRTPIKHHPIERLEQMHRRIEHYSNLSAQMMVERGKRVSFLDAYLHGFWAFFRTYIVRLGFLDGPEGLAVARYNATGTYRKYKKAWQTRRDGR